MKNSQFPSSEELNRHLDSIELSKLAGVRVHHRLMIHHYMEWARKIEQEVIGLRDALYEYNETAVKVLDICAAGTAGTGTPQSEAFCRLDVAWIRARARLNAPSVALDPNAIIRHKCDNDCLINGGCSDIYSL